MKLINENLAPVAADRFLQCIDTSADWLATVTLHDRTGCPPDRVFEKTGLSFHRLGEIRRICLRIFSRIADRLLVTRSATARFARHGQKLVWIKNGAQPSENPGGSTPSTQTGRWLAGQSILFIGGRAALYPQYRSLIEAAGGHLVLFRQSRSNAVTDLTTWLNRVNQIICPVDCIRHEDFFMVRNYCERTGKPCFLLPRSDMKTFARAVERLCTSRSSAADAPDQNRMAA